MTFEVAGLVMAAGRSRRFGRDKRLERLPDGRTLLQTSLSLARRHFARTFVVIGAEDEPERLGLDASVEVIRAPAGEPGLGTNIGAAFRHLNSHSVGSVAAAVLLADLPWIKDSTLTTLLEVASESGIHRPVYHRRPGHPVLFGRRFWPALARLRGEAGARQLIRENPGAYKPVAVSDPGVLRDIDRPEDLPPR